MYGRESWVDLNSSLLELELADVKILRMIMGKRSEAKYTSEFECGFD